jgi:hypothetical protein
MSTERQVVAIGRHGDPATRKTALWAKRLIDIQIT